MNIGFSGVRSARPRFRWGYPALVAAVAGERLAELTLSVRNARRTRAAGGVETGQGHYPAMVAIHAALLAGCLVEARARQAPVRRSLALPALATVAAAQALRWWCIASLGDRWNTRILVVPGEAAVRRGPYRWLRHPNYVAVVAEGIALPLVHSAYRTAIAFTATNALVLRLRLRAENAALDRLDRGAG